MLFWNSLFLWSNGCFQFYLCYSTFSKSRLNIWKFTVHVLLKPGLENLEDYFASMWDEFNCTVVWTFFGIAFCCDWNENWPFPNFHDNLLVIKKSVKNNKNLKPKAMKNKPLDILLIQEQVQKEEKFNLKKK